MARPRTQKTETAPGADDALTPAMRQYAQQKALVPDALLLFRIGDFYELFYDDARTAARVLNLTLTSRSKENPIPLAGIPHHALDSYLRRLVRAGFKVAISEQTEDARFAKGVVKREILRVVTPGTLTDDTLLDARAGNVLAAVHGAGLMAAGGATGDDGPQVGLACVELASGRFWTEMVAAERLAAELARIRPAELIAAETPIDCPTPILDQAREICGAAVTRRPADRFDEHRARDLLHEHFRVRTLEGFGLGRMDDSLCAAGAILDYLCETQRGALAHVLKIERRCPEHYVALEATALRGLEVERTLRDGSRENSLLGAVDRSSNPMGARRLREWLCFPLRDPRAILARQDAVAELRRDRSRLISIRGRLHEMADVERIIGRLGVGRASPRDLAGLGRSLGQAESVAGLLQSDEATKRRSDEGAQPEGNLQAASCKLQSDSTREGIPDAEDARRDSRTSGNPQSAIRNPQSFPGLLPLLADALRGWSELATYLASAIRPDAGSQKDPGYIADGFDAELDRLRTIQTDGQKWIAQYQAREVERTGIGSLKVAYNSVFGYYIEVTNTHRAKVPPEYVRRQTVRNAERYITDELKKYEDEVLGAEERAKQREIDLFEEIKARVGQELGRLRDLANALADLDVLAGLTELSLERNYCRPELVATDLSGPERAGSERAAQASVGDGPAFISSSSLAGASCSDHFAGPSCADGPARAMGNNAQATPGFPQDSGHNGDDQSPVILEILDGRHPVLDGTLSAKFVPNDCVLGGDAGTLAIITGPNMAGKSTYIRQVALLTLLAQTGSYVPARSMRWTPVDRIFARVGASDEIARGQSTFMVEMVETAQILNGATARSLVVLDEIGRGTSTFDGLAIAWAISEHLVRNIGCRTLFATHYHELTELSDLMPGVANLNVAVREHRGADGRKEIVFLHKIVQGATDRSYGVHVARMAGIPHSVVERSGEVLAELERSFAAESRTPKMKPRRVKPGTMRDMLLFPEPDDGAYAK